MLDFNASTTLPAYLVSLIDAALTREERAVRGRLYLHASRLSAPCERALQYDFLDLPADPDQQPSGSHTRIADRDRLIGGAMGQWLRMAGFDLRVEDERGDPFAFSMAGGRIQGYLDGIVVAGPAGFAYPMLWQNQCLGPKAWRPLVKKKLAAAEPLRAGQIALYQAYLDLHANPALFTAVNTETMELHVELVAFDSARALRMSERALRIVNATEVGDLLPRVVHDAGHAACQACPWRPTCWQATGSQP